MRQSLKKCYLIDSQVYSSVGNNAEHVGDVALVKCCQALFLKYVFSAVRDAGVLTSLSQG